MGEKKKRMENHRAGGRGFLFPRFSVLYRSARLSLCGQSE